MLQRSGKKPFSFIHIADSPTIQDSGGEGRQTKPFGKTSANRVIGIRCNPFVTGKSLLLS